MDRIRPESPPLKRCPAEGQEHAGAASCPRPPRRPQRARPARGAKSPRPLSAARVLGAGGSPRLQKSPPHPVVETRDQPPRDSPAPWGFGGGTHDAGARTGAFGSGQIPGIQLKSWLAPLAGRRSRGICIMKIDSSKLPAWQPGRAPAGGGTSCPGRPGRSPGGGDKSRGGDLAGRGGTRVSQPFQRGGLQTFLERKDVISGHLPPLITFLRLPSDARSSIHAPAIVVCKHSKGKPA